MEAIRTNAIGTDNTLKAALNNKVKKIVVLSTDKAAYPINAMGLTKALMEKIMIARSRIAEEQGIVICGTRYGNVMASRGSVIPLFIKQIQAGQELTVTDRDMTRFMMNLADAVDLVLYAFQHAKAGDLFVQKAPAATIDTLVEALKQILKSNNPVKVIGTRHGEKLYETLLTREEMARAEDLGDYFRIPADSRELNYNLYFTEGMTKVGEFTDYHSHNARRLGVDEMTKLLLNLEVVQNVLNNEKC